MFGLFRLFLGSFLVVPSLGVLVRRLLLFVFLVFLVPSFTAVDHAEASRDDDRNGNIDRQEEEDGQTVQRRNRVTGKKRKSKLHLPSVIAARGQQDAKLRRLL